MRKITILILACSLLQGCAGPGAMPSTDARASGEIPVKVVALDPATHAPMPTAARKLHASFPLVLGSLFGRPTQGIGYDPEAVLGETFTLDLDRLSFAASSHAAPIEGFMQLPGISVQPTTLKLARIGTYFLDETGAYSAAGAGFIEANRRHALLLVYFDRQVRIKGRAQAWNENQDVDLSIPAAGLYWLEVSDAAGTTRVRLAEKPLTVYMQALGLHP